MAVQTVRNWIIVSTFLATVAITISLTTIQLTMTMSTMPLETNRLHVFDIASPLLGVKALIVVACNLFSFFVLEIDVVLLSIGEIL